MKKILLLAALTCSSMSAIAKDLEAKFEGMFVFEGGTRKQKSVPTGNNLTGNTKNSSTTTASYFSALVSSETDAMKYGGRIVLHTTTVGSSSPSYEGSHIFGITDYGKGEIGSGFDAATQMRITGFDVSRGSGDNWTDYTYFTPGAAMAPTPRFFLNGFHKDGNIETSRKVTYFTPKINGVQFGASYIPDAGNTGSTTPGNTDVAALKTRVVDANPTTRYVEKAVTKNAVALGATFEHNISDGVDVKLSATGEIGKAAQKGVTGTPDPTDARAVLAAGSTEYKLADMRTYNIGAVLNYGNFSYAGSYGDVRGFTSREVDANKRHTRFYTAAASYVQGPVGISLSYALGDAQKNKIDSVTIGTDYKLAPGLMPYAEFTYFKGKGMKFPVLNDPKKFTTKGTVALIGLKLKF
jgi:hypothetical protein